MAMDLVSIREHWRKVGEQLSAAEKVTGTTRDPILGSLEEDCLARYLQPSNTVLEIGCGDAAHTVRYARQVRRIFGLDVADTLIAHARQRVERARIENVEFVVGSVLDLERIFGAGDIDCVLSQRCLINLPTWEHQQDALLKIHAVLPKGGVFLMTEGFQEEFDNLNHVREKVGLSPMKVVSYNRNLRHEEFDSFIAPHFEVEAVHGYGLYLLLSRVFHPLAMLPAEPRHDSPLNEAAGLLERSVSLPECRRFSYNLLYVLRRR
jgi:SAM-dependent methyltransferase